MLFSHNMLRLFSLSPYFSSSFTLDEPFLQSIFATKFNRRAARTEQKTTSYYTNTEYSGFFPLRDRNTHAQRALANLFYFFHSFSIRMLREKTTFHFQTMITWNYDGLHMEVVYVCMFIIYYIMIGRNYSWRGRIAAY